MNIRYSLCLLTLALCLQCGVYTFSGSTLPAHLKSVNIPLFINESMQPDVAEKITAEVTSRVLSTNLLRIARGTGDATLSGTVKEYQNIQYQYDVQAVREATISSYIVRIAVAVEFYDNKKQQALYKGLLTGQGIYDFTTQKEEDGQRTAVKDIVDQIVQNSVQSW